MSAIQSLLAKIAGLRRRLGLVRARPLSQFQEIRDTIERQLSPRDRNNALPDLDRASVVELRDNGCTNWLIIAGKERRVKPKFILFPGAAGNIIVLGEGSDQPRELRFEGSNNIAVFGNGIAWAQVSVRFVSNEAVVSLGHGSIYNGTSIIAEGDGCGVEIGRNCLFAPGTTIRTSDLHGMYDMASGEWLNPPKPVRIEPHTWFGQDALVLKGAEIGGGSVVAARAVVNSKLPQFCVSAGSPARPVREGVCWSLERSPKPEQLDTVQNMLQQYAEIDEA